MVTQCAAPGCVKAKYLACISPCSPRQLRSQKTTNDGWVMSGPMPACSRAIAG